MSALIGGAILSGLNSMFSNMLSDRNTRLAQLRNYNLNEWSAINADRRARALYQDLQSPQALLEQYREAGLSPSLMLGAGGGVSGHLQAGAQGAGGAGPVPQMFGFNLLEGAQAQLAMAQADKLKAETKTIEGENERGKGEIANLWANAGYTKTSTALTEAQITQQNWQNYITSETAQYDINKAFALSEQAANAAIKSNFEVLSAQAKAEVDQRTIEALVEQAIQNVEYTKAETLLAKSNIKVNEARIREINAEIEKWRKEVEIEFKDMETRIYNAATERAKWRTTDEIMDRQTKVLEKRLNFDKDITERKFTWQIVNDTYNNLLKAYNSVTPIP